MGCLNSDENIHTAYPINNHLHIYTDGSLNQETNKAGMGIVVYKHNEESPTKTTVPAPANWPICDIEMAAINKALAMLKGDKQEVENLVIFTDSLSALQKIKTQTTTSDPLDPLTADFLRHIEDIVSRTRIAQIILQWVPGHMGITGNELADQEAKRGLAENPPHRAMHYSVAKRIIAQHNRREWILEWKNSTNKTVRHYADKRPIPIKSDPADELSRANQAAITLLRLRQFSTKQWLNRIGKIPDPNCECGQIETISHLLIYCPKSNDSRKRAWGLEQPTLKSAIFGTANQLNKTLDFLRCTGRL